jgi:hypothetical protein
VTPLILLGATKRRIRRPQKNGMILVTMVKLDLVQIQVKPLATLEVVLIRVNQELMEEAVLAQATLDLGCLVNLRLQVLHSMVVQRKRMKMTISLITYSLILKLKRE